MFDPLILGFAQSDQTVAENVTLWLPAALIDRDPAKHEKLLPGILNLSEVRTFNLRVQDDDFDLLVCRLVLEGNTNTLTVKKKLAEMIGTLYGTSVKFVEATALDLVPWPEPATPTEPVVRPASPLPAPKGWFARLMESLALKWAV